MDYNKQITVIERTRVIKDYSVGIYARVSTSNREQLDSLAAQVSGLTRMAASHRTWFVFDIFEPNRRPAAIACQVYWL